MDPKIVWGLISIFAIIGGLGLVIYALRLSFKPWPEPEETKVAIKRARNIIMMLVAGVFSFAFGASWLLISWSRN